MATLNMEQGGEISKNLKSLYSYMFSQLVEANMEKKSKPVLVVIDLLKELRAAWVQIREKKKPDATKRNALAQEMPQLNQANTEKRIKVTG